MSTQWLVMSLGLISGIPNLSRESRKSEVRIKVILSSKSTTLVPILIYHNLVQSQVSVQANLFMFGTWCWGTGYAEPTEGYMMTSPIQSSPILEPNDFDDNCESNDPCHWKLKFLVIMMSFQVIDQPYSFGESPDGQAFGDSYTLGWAPSQVLFT
jgi:hypothetical protein